MIAVKNFKLGLNRDTLLYLVLLGLTQFSTIFPVNFVFGLSFSFTSIFTFIIFRLYGLPYALISCLLTFFFIKNDFLYIAYNIILFLEILVVGLYFYFRKNGKMFFVDAGYWLSLGLLLIFTLNKTSLAGQTLYFQICKDILNGLFNVLVADMALAYFPFYRFLKSIELNKNNVSVHQFLTHITIILILVPLFLSTLTNTWHVHEEITSQTYLNAENTMNHMMKDLYQLEQTDPDFLAKDTRHPNILDELIEQYQSLDYNIIITDDQYKVLSTSTKESPIKGSFYNWNEIYDTRQLANHYYEALPMDQNDVFPIMKWRSGKLIYINNADSLSLKIFIQFPISQYQDDIFKEFLSYLRLSVLFSIFTIIFVQVISRLFIKNIERLTMVSTNLPQKLVNLEKVEWPQSNISELRSLTQNLKKMAQKLKELFQESIEMNNVLTIQTKKLKESEEKLHQLAYYDVLTDLPNRLHFQNYVSDLIAHNISDKIAIIFMDLNQFKQINDTLGHNAGDTLLQLTAIRFSKLLDTNRIVFRLSGDEFVIVQKYVSRVEITHTLNLVQQEFSIPFQLNEEQLYITGSIGISLYPEDGCDLDSLLKCADIAMYVSKENGGNVAQFFNESMRDRFQERLIVENSLRAVVDKGGFEIFYQPKLQFGQVSSLEALLRWNDSELGNVAPSIFIPIAEEIGLITNIDEWALIEACRQNKKWQDEHAWKIPVAVNISAKHFEQEHLVPLIIKALTISGLEPKYLKLEITESVFIKDPTQVADVIYELKNLGVQISIDDFGKGYSAFIHLLQLPIDEIKIDQQFIKNIDYDEKKALLVKSLIDLAHGLNLNIVAEGIETIDERDALYRLGCDELQGYLFSPPINVLDIENFLTIHNTKSTDTFVLST
ncbi:putative bifunctional diguanylate cyclase/phosphodiesterase [Bacillus sp. T3]|uniref:putative bifunctional diguanylate cyclase/phosphodiesterase n=1 Tax=Bacillus sp. T3 TaxID=467262 RepID=UPI002980DCE4|nr:EAL domain-containing protein [Bacillus sp. T3]